MKRTYIFLIAITLAFCTACKKDKKDVDESTDPIETEEVTNQTNSTTHDDSFLPKGESRKIVVKLEPKSNSMVKGNVVFKQEGGLVTMVAVMSGLSEGTHAIHLHETADCSSDDGTSTGGHWNPTAQPHGKFGDTAGYHKGDIGNFEANANGNGTVTFITKEWCIGCSDPSKDIIGKAVIIHQGSDDFKTQPTGAAGGRVSCGGVIQ